MVIGFIEIRVSWAGASVSEGFRTFVVCPERMAVLGSMVNQIAEKDSISATVLQQNAKKLPKLWVLQPIPVEHIVKIYSEK